MKLKAFILSLSVFTVGVPLVALAAGTAEITVVSYNIFASRMATLDTIADAITSLGAGIIAIQEVDDNTGRSARTPGQSAPVDQAVILSEKTGLYYSPCTAIEFEGGHYGSAFFSRWPVASTEKIALVNQNDAEQRVACINTVHVPGVPVPLVVVSTHLDHADDNSLRLLQVDQLLEIVEDAGKKGALLLLGDFNLKPSSLEYAKLVSRLDDTFRGTDALTWPSDVPEMRIDYIMTSRDRGWEVSKTYIPSPNDTVKGERWSRISDHLPVVSVLRLPQKQQ